ncbi:MAG: CoA transferase [Alphaproteobacteria bacterium]|nr:CoA transferase [Alphaproteobacteria bacterium]MCW5741264.1 CoA transferase [Alphaproteobacteria bacterium]
MTDQSLPFAGLKVLDISSFIAAPAAAVILADYGADVIKVEGPDGDPNRTIVKDSPSYPKGPINYPWAMDSRHKRSIALDLKQSAAREALDRLIAQSDVLIINFPPPVRERLRLRYEDCRAINPRLIYASLTGYGESGPDRDRPGFDATAYFARSGLFDVQRYEGGPPGTAAPAQGDRATAVALFASILMALLHRQKTGEGSWVGTSLYANGLWSNGVFAQGALVGSFLAPRPPRDRPRSALGNIYRTRDDRWLQLTIVREDKLWAPLCRALEEPELIDDPRFAELDARRANSKDLVTILDGIFLTRDYEDWRERLAAQSITFGVIGRVQDLPTDEQAVHAGAIIDADVPEAPRQINNPIRLSFAQTRTPRPAPVLGEHGETILREAGMDAGAIAALKASKGLL